MNSLIAWFVSPRLIDLILLLTLAEAFALMVWPRTESSASGRRAIGWMLLPGIFLMLALRAALAGEPWPWVPAALTGALISHLFDLRGRLRR